MRQLLTVVLLAVVGLFAELARADVLPPDAQPCLGKAVGAACPGGACANSTCSRYDYLTHTTVNFACLRCVQGAQPTPVPATPWTSFIACAGIIGAIGLLKARAKSCEIDARP